MSKQALSTIAAQYGEHVKQAGAFAQAVNVKLEKVAKAEEAWAAKSTELASKVAAAGLIDKGDLEKFAAFLTEGDASKVAQAFEHVIGQATKAAAFQASLIRPNGRTVMGKQASSTMSEADAAWEKTFGSAS